MDTASATIGYLDRVLPALDHVGGRLAGLVTTAPDPDVRLSHGSDWTVRDAAAHVVTVVGRYADGPEGHGTWVSDPTGLSELNQAQIHTLGPRSMGELAGTLRHDLTALAAQLRGYGDRVPTFRFHGGERVPADVALGILLGELVVHGWDIAQALGQPWPVDPSHVGLIVEGVNPILSGWVNPTRARGFTATFEVRPRRQAAHVWAFRDGRLEVDPGDHRPVDVHVWADPAALLLVLYRRQSLWRHIAAGRLVAWGRKPWLALTLADRFHKP
jgi:uncharacterized protein (TIGR03083 family)